MRLRFICPFYTTAVRNKLPTVPGTVDGSRNGDAVKWNRAQKEKMKTYTDAKPRAKPTESKTEDDVLVKHKDMNDKLTSYWANDLFTVAKVKGPTIIVKRKRDGEVFARSISMVIQMTIQISIVAVLPKWIQKIRIQTAEEVNAESAENEDSANNVRRSSRTRSPPIRLAEVNTHL